MGFVDRLAGPHRARRSARRDPAAAQWRRRAELMDVDRDLAELADEQAYIEAEAARSREHTARLDSAAAAAAADGCADVARDLRTELGQTQAFLAELAEVRQAVALDRGRLLDLRKRLMNGGPVPIETTDPGSNAPAPRTAKTAVEDNVPSRRSS